MRSQLFLSLVIALTIFSCGSDQANSGTQAFVDEWFPGQYKVVEGQKAASKTDTFSLVQLQSTNDPNLKFSVDFYPKKKNGGLEKAAVQNAIKAAEVNVKPARALLEILYENGLKNVVVGTDMEKNGVNIQLYEEPFTSVFSSRLKQIQKLCLDWATQQNLKPCNLNLLVMDPKAWGQKFTEIIDARFIRNIDDWTYQNTIANAGGDLADPVAAELFPGSLRLNNLREMEIRKKTHAAVTQFLQTAKKQKFTVELQGMVNSDWDLRSMDKIRYYFPYCQKAPDTDQNGGCMGQFEGRVSCIYTFKTGEMEIDFF